MNRKLMIIAAVAASTPAVSAAEPAGDPPTPRLEFAFEEVVSLGQAITPGKTPLGGRNIIPITGGVFQGAGIRGTILPGAVDWQLMRADGCTELKADYFIRTDDGVVINVVNKGPLCPPVAGEPPSTPSTHPVFEAPLGRYDWLNRATFVGTIGMAKAPEGGPAVRIRFYRVK